MPEIANTNNSELMIGVVGLKVTIAPVCGFCFGVKRAVQLAQDARGKAKVKTLGQLIHNRQVIDRLQSQGIEPVDDLSHVDRGTTVIFRSHGVGPQVYEQAKQQELMVVDATCPFVRKAQQGAQEFAEQGCQVVIAGEKGHPEVESIKAWAGEAAIIVENMQQALAVPACDKIGLVCQTTLAKGLFEEIRQALQTRCRELLVNVTICTATAERQKAAQELAKISDVMLVIGGKHSANTNHLVQLCTNSGAKTYHIETATEINPKWFTNSSQIGITAGASTPDWIIEEVYHTMQSMDFSEALEDSFKVIKRGDVVEGTVVQVGKDEVMVDIGFKSEGVVRLRELTSRPDVTPEQVVKVGDVIDVFVLSTEDKEGNVILSKKRADWHKGWKDLQVLFNEQTVFPVFVDAVVKGGLVAYIHEVRAFIPASQADRRFVTNLESYVGKELPVKIIELDQEKNKLILSHKVVAEQEFAAQEAAVWENIVEGQVISGIVKNIVSYGAFVDIGGVEGLLHISDMSWERINHPSEILQVGDDVKVMITKANPETKRVSLSLKQTGPNPWTDVEQRYPIGSVVDGIVMKTVPFGAFVQLEPGIEGLVHISQLADKHVVKPEEVVVVGQQVKVRVLDVNVDQKRISLSVKDADNIQIEAAAGETLNEQHDHE